MRIRREAQSVDLPGLETASPIKARHGRIDDIEVLRAVAVIFVIVFHAHGNLITWPNRGFDWFTAHFVLACGVNIFFGVSGFVIARSILASLVATRSTPAYVNLVLSFWTRRVWRLLPSAWLWLIVIEIAAIAFNRSNAFSTPRVNYGALEAGMLNIANFRFTQVFFFDRRDYGASFPYWSLSLEEQFYLLFPIVVFAARNYLKHVIAILVAAQWLFTPQLYPYGFHAVKIDGLLCGVLVAIWSDHKSYEWLGREILGKIRLVMPLIVLALLMGLGTSAATYDRLPFAFSPAPVTILCTILVAIASFDRGYVMPGGAAKRIMLWIGSRSYALYLIHIPVFCATREIWFRVEPTGTTFGATFTLRYVLTALIFMAVLSELNYRLVERPLRAYGARIADGIQRRGGDLTHLAGPRTWGVGGLVLAGWIGAVAVVDATRSGWTYRAFGRPVASGQELAISPMFERLEGAGWSGHERWGTWSVGERAALDIPVSDTISGHAMLVVKGSVLTGEKRPEASVTFKANGVELGHYTAVIGSDDIDAKMEIPAQVFAADPGRVHIDILVDRPVSPYTLGRSFDQRELGFALNSMKLLEE